MTPIVTVVNTRLHVLTAWSSVTAIYRQQCSTSRRGYFELSFEIMKNETRPPMRAKQPQMPAGNVTSNPHTRKAPASSSDVCPVSFPQTSKANRGMKATANSRQARTKRASYHARFESCRPWQSVGWTRPMKSRGYCRSGLLISPHIECSPRGCPYASRHSPAFLAASSVVLPVRGGLHSIRNLLW